MLSTQEIAKVRQYLNGQDEQLPEVFKILSEPHRCQMFRALAKQGELAVSDLARIRNISAPLASQHLKIMLFGGLLSKRKQGQTVYYRLNQQNPIVSSILKAIK